jgi:hypothetical protein
MIGSLGVAMSVFGSLLGTDKAKTTQSGGAAGFDITQLVGGKSDVTDDGVNTSDSVSTGTQDALSMLKDMTDGGMTGYFKWMVKQIREKTMESMGVTEESLAAMPEGQRTAMEQKIEEAVKKDVAKIMGVDDETAGKMVAAADKSSAVATPVEADKAYKVGGTSAAEMLGQLLNS